MSKFGQVVFIIDDGRIIETTIRDFGGQFVDEITTPNGVSSIYHVRENELWTWGRGCIKKFNTDAEAIEALEDIFVHDFWSNPEILAFKDRASAEQCLRDLVNNE